MSFFPFPDTLAEISSVLVKAESVESLQSMMEDSERSSSSVHPDIPSLPSFSVDPLQPPTWKTHRDTSHDLLCDVSDKGLYSQVASCAVGRQC